MPLLKVKNLRAHFHTRNGIVRAVDGVSFDVDENEITGIVGESGSGKSALCQSIMGLVPCPPGCITCDEITFDGVRIDGLDEKKMRRIRGDRMTMIFQDPMTSLNPSMRIIDQLVEPMLIHRKAKKGDAITKAVELLAAVGIPNAARRARQFPHEFSGGMRQRVCIAMALMTDPKLVFADEPTTALDVTVQAQILALLRSLKQRTAISVVLVTHDFGIVAGLCDRIMVMYAGTIVERAATRDIFLRPMHPYTHALLRALPSRACSGEPLYSIPGRPPDPSQQISGCPFAPRCEYASATCRTAATALAAAADMHYTACARVLKGEIGNHETGLLKERL